MYPPASYSERKDFSGIEIDTLDKDDIIYEIKNMLDEQTDDESHLYHDEL